MIQVLIIADTLLRAHNLAKLLSEEEHLEIAGVHSAPFFQHRAAEEIADVMVVSGLPLRSIPSDGLPAVVLTDEIGGEQWLSNVIHALIPADCTPAEIAAAVTAVAMGWTVLTQEQTARWLPHGGRKRQNGYEEVETLTPREMEVLRLLAAGLGNKEIAGQLDISDHTAKFHVAQILAKLGAASRAEAVAIGIRRGLVPV